MNKLALATAVCAIAGVPLAINAAPMDDQARCTALGQRADQVETGCVDRCVQHGQRRLDTMGQLGTTDVAGVFAHMSQCADVCIARHDWKMARLAALTVCGGAMTLDPCKGAALHVQADAMGCHYRCARRAYGVSGFDLAACDDECDARRDDRMAINMAQPACGCGGAM